MDRLPWPAMFGVWGMHEGCPRLRTTSKAMILMDGVQPEIEKKGGRLEADHGSTKLKFCGWPKARVSQPRQPRIVCCLHTHRPGQRRTDTRRQRDQVSVRVVVVHLQQLAPRERADVVTPAVPYDDGDRCMHVDRYG